MGSMVTQKVAHCFSKAAGGCKAPQVGRSEKAVSWAEDAAAL